jgi:serine protease inhibitor
MIFRRKFMQYALLLLSFSFLTANSLNQSLNNFSINLFKEINHNEEKNILISPLSVSYALMMVNKGASNNTSDNILSTLNIKSDDINNHYSLNKLIEKLLSD